MIANALGARVVVIRMLFVVATAAFAVASIVHSGVTIGFGPMLIDDPFKGAAVPEAVIAIVLGIGSASVIYRWPGAWWLAFGTALFALLLTIFGLTVTVRSSRTGDIAYHVTILVVLVVIVSSLLVSKGRRGYSPRI